MARRESRLSDATVEAEANGSVPNIARDPRAVDSLPEFLLSKLAKSGSLVYGGAEMESPMAKGDRLKQAEERWKQLVSALDAELAVLKPSRYKAGRILYEIKVFLEEQGWDKGRRGRWKPLLEQRFGRAVSTANDLVRDYEEDENLPASKRFFARRKPSKSQQHRQKNSAETALLSDAKIAPAPDKEVDENQKEPRLAVECDFVLTMDEKSKFMKAVDKVGETRATQLMYQAVVSDAERSQDS